MNVVRQIAIVFLVYIVYLCFGVESSSRIPIVYVYTVVPAVCNHGLPTYIRISLEQALLTQPDCDVVMASNYRECPLVKESVSDIPNLITIDIAEIATEKTLSFHNLSSNLFQLDYSGELWITSALRFFNMEDIMINRGYSEMIHVEADNMIYGRYSSVVPTLRQGFKGLAVTPLTANKIFFTASVLWVSSLQSLQSFNNFLYLIASNTTHHKQYLNWLRPFACCKHGGVDQDARGFGIKPFAINEMSLMAFFHELYPQDLRLLPVVPRHNYAPSRFIRNSSIYGPDGPETGPATGEGIWDPNSWGQLVGGTHFKRGKDKGFIDGSHIVGQAVRSTGCWLSFKCSSQSTSDHSYGSQRPYYLSTNSSHQCLTAPHVRCHVNATWTPLWNLHVHSKQTSEYVSRPCICGSDDIYVSSPNAPHS